VQVSQHAYLLPLLKHLTGIYFTFTTYGAFAVREFIGADLFDVLLTENPTRWPWHAWINFPLVPLTLIASRTPLVLWTTSPLVPLLFSWPSTTPANATTAAAATALRFTVPTRPQLWPPPPVLVCALFPSVRAIYTRLRSRITNALVPPPPARPPQAPGQQPQDQPQPQQQQPQQQQQGRAQAGREAAAGGAPQRFGLQIREHFDLEIRAHIRVGHAHDPPAPAAAAAGGDAADLPAQEQQAPPQDQQQQPEQPQPEQQQQAQEQADPAAAMNEEDFAAAAARTIRLTTASFGRLVGGALAMPTIARMMGAALLRLSYVMPLVRAIIAPREQQLPTNVPAAAAVGLLGFWNNLQRSRLFGGWNGQQQQQQQQQQLVLIGGKTGALGAKVLSGLFLSTSQEWAMSDPVWYVPPGFSGSSVADFLL
jgi:hypothetical protein